MVISRILPWAAGKLWPLGGRQALAPGRPGTSGPWRQGTSPLVIWRILPWDPRLPVAIPGELEGIPEEVSGWNGSELNSERIHVRFSRNRRWNSGGWHRPGEAESGGFLPQAPWASGGSPQAPWASGGSPQAPWASGGSPQAPWASRRIPSSAAGHLADSPRWSSHGPPPLVICRMCRGIPGLRSRFRASSRGFPGKFLDGMAQN